jgi:hypothetical protein
MILPLPDYTYDFRALKPLSIKYEQQSWRKFIFDMQRLRIILGVWTLVPRGAT